MTLLRTLMVLLCLCSASLGAADPIPVSSGEHGAFSRLVFEGRNVRGWVYKKNNGNHVIAFPRQQDGFTTQSIYRYISDDRLSSFAANNSEFRFRTGCACDVDIFEIGATVLVVDIKTKKQKNLFDILATSPRSSPLQFGALTVDSNTRSSTYPEIVFNLKAKTQMSSKVKNGRANPQVQNFNLLSNVSPTKEQEEVIEGLQTQLLRQIGSASSLGVLDAHFNLDTNQKREKRPQVDPRIFDSSHKSMDSKQTRPVQIRITSSADLTNSRNLPANSTSSGRLCIDPARVDISAWSDGRPFEQQLASLRRVLFGEFDDLNAATALTLARLYLHYGFGAEARNILNLIGSEAENWPELFEIAQVLEYGFAHTGQVLRRHVECNSAAALWGILASEKLDKNHPVNVQAALRSVDALPAHLRKFLSPELSSRLLKYGDRVGAKTAMRNLDRLSSPADDRATLAQADIEVSKGGLEIAEILLDDVVNSNSEFSARALISLIETQMDLGHPIDIATANLVEAYATELRGAPIGVELSRVHVLALAKAGQFKASFDALDDLDLDRGANALQSKFFELLVADADDPVFLHLVFEHMPRFIGDDKEKSVFDAAVRLQKLGFSEVAEKFLVDGNVTLNSKPVRMLRARIALNLGRPAAADVFLSQLKGKDAEVLRAQAKEQKLDRKTAHEIYLQLENTRAAQENAWLSDDWQTLTDPNFSVFGSLVPVANKNLRQPENTIGMMARSQSLLLESLEVRDIVDSILKNEND